MKMGEDQISYARNVIDAEDRATGGLAWIVCGNADHKRVLCSERVDMGGALSPYLYFRDRLALIAFHDNNVARRQLFQNLVQRRFMLIIEFMNERPTPR
jgi:hypothetical protein